MHRMVYEINHPTSKKLLIYFGSAIAQLDGNPGKRTGLSGQSG